MIGFSFHFKYKSSGVFYCLIILFFINLWKIRILLAEFGRFYRAHTYKGRGVTQCSMQIYKKIICLPSFFTSDQHGTFNVPAALLPRPPQPMSSLSGYFILKKAKQLAGIFLELLVEAEAGEQQTLHHVQLLHMLSCISLVCQFQIKQCYVTQKYMS